MAQAKRVKPELYVKNQQRSRSINRRHLCRIIRSFLQDDLHREQYVLAVYLVNDRRITQLNETHLRHAGPTDVIAFDYSDERSSRRKEADSLPLMGDVFICVEEAIRQSGKYHTSWQSEVIRYIVHGILHLCGYDDQTVAARKKMKREEDRLLRELSTRFSFTRLKA
jgi:probable rRNA maturation factor